MRAPRSANPARTGETTTAELADAETFVLEHLGTRTPDSSISPLPMDWRSERWDSSPTSDHVARITEIREEYSADYELLKPIPVEFDNIGGNIVACFREAKLSFSGVDRTDALDHLGDWISGTHEFLTGEVSKDPVVLGVPFRPANSPSSTPTCVGGSDVKAPTSLGWRMSKRSRARPYRRGRPASARHRSECSPIPVGAEQRLRTPTAATRSTLSLPRQRRQVTRTPDNVRFPH